MLVVRAETRKDRVMAKIEKDRAENSRQMRSGEGSFIAAGCHLQGDFTFSGPLTVAGSLKGRIKSDGMVIVETQGMIDGILDAAIIIVHGKLNGSALATDSMEIWAGSDVRGNVHTRSIRVDEGSLLTADLTISEVLPEQCLDLSQEASSTEEQTPVPPAVPQRSSSPLPGSNLARRLAAMNENQ